MYEQSVPRPELQIFRQPLVIVRPAEGDARVPLVVPPVHVLRGHVTSEIDEEVVNVILYKKFPGKVCRSVDYIRFFGMLAGETSFPKNDFLLPSLVFCHLSVQCQLEFDASHSCPQSSRLLYRNFEHQPWLECLQVEWLFKEGRGEASGQGRRLVEYSERRVVVREADGGVSPVPAPPHRGGEREDGELLFQIRVKDNRGQDLCDSIFLFYCLFSMIFMSRLRLVKVFLGGQTVTLGKDIFAME